MERQEIKSTDLASATLDYTGVTYRGTQGTFFGTIVTKITSYKNEAIATAEEKLIQDTVSYTIWNFFKFYADCDCHFMFDKDEIANNMINRDINDIMTSVTNYMIKNKIGPLNTMKIYDPTDEYNRQIDREDKGMGEISPINADIDSLVNPSTKNKNVGSVEEESTNTTMWNKMQVFRYLTGDYSFKTIIEGKLKKYIYELNRIY